MCNCRRSQFLRRLFPTLIAIAAVSIPLAATSAQGDGHSGHGSAAHGTEQQARIGDPYLLEIDPVSGKKLGPIDRQVVRLEQGREFRFASKETAEQFAGAPSKYVPAVDAKQVEQQMPLYPLEVCVVSGERLDAQAGVVDFVWANRLVRVSKQEHARTFLADPAKYVAKLDAAVIAKQKPSYGLTTCVVSGEKLGDMGDPIDHVAGNRLVRFCCKSCVKEFGKDPVRFLGRLDANAKKKAGASDTSGSRATYACPMHADVVQEKPGRCPKCGMDLVKRK